MIVQFTNVSVGAANPDFWGFFRKCVCIANAKAFYERKEIIFVYNDIIKKLLKRIEVLPKKVVILYLMKAYNLSANMANQAIYAACRAKACFEINDGDYIARLPYIKAERNTIQRAKAFRVALEFLPDSQEFVCAQHPWLLAFVSSGSLVQVGYIERDMEVAESSLIASIHVPVEDRATTKRIIIAEEGCRLDKMKRAGISFICCVNDAFDIEILEKRYGDDVWNDVP